VEQPTITVSNTIEGTFETFMNNGWGDGLPLVPPTAERVELMLGDFDPDEIAAVVPPGTSDATVLKVAVNAVMAGCLPAHLPIVLAALRAACASEFNLYALQTTTNPVTVAGFVNGPVIDALGFNGSWNCFGQGSRANATVGRAIRLVLLNVGGARPGELDRATHGQPGKYSFFFAENEAQSPWEPNHVAAGYPRETSTVTVIGAAGTLNMIEPTDDASELLRTFAGAMRSAGGNDAIFNGEPWIAMSPEHADVLVKAGHTKESIRRELWQQTRIPLREFSRKTAEYWVVPSWEPILGPLKDDSLIPLGAAPEHIRLVVAGGPSIHSVFIPTFGDTRAVTLPVLDAGGAPIVYAI
jgi:hypothetical protein